uniref:NFAT activation molecule 1 n=1 Tax=Pristiophorus japonicus TaxID=55135 RepID=UPI00398F3F9A
MITGSVFNQTKTTTRNWGKRQTSLFDFSTNGAERGRRMSPTTRILIALVLYSRQGQGKLDCHISQTETIIVAVVNEIVTFPCQYRCHTPTSTATSPAPPVPYTVKLLKGTQQIIETYSGSSAEPNFAKGWELIVQGTDQSGMYYCHGEAQSIRSEGKGTFLQVRDRGYVEPTSSLTLPYTLVSVCMGLAVYSVIATSAVLIKRKICNRCKSHLMKTAHPDSRQLSASDQVQTASESQQASAAGQAAEPADSDNAYMALQTHQEYIYSTLDSDTTGICNSAAANGPKRQHAQIVEAEAECVYESF